MTKTTQYKNTPIGPIPTDWEVKKLGELVDITSGNSPSDFNLLEIGRYPYLKVEDLNNSFKYQISSREYTDDIFRNVVVKNSLIFPKRGAAIINNKIRISKVDCYLDSNLMALKISDKSKLDLEYLYYKVLDIQLFKIADTSSIPQLNNKHIIPFKIPLPPLPEQQKIAEVLSTWDKAIQETDTIIKKLEDRNKALAFSLLTGKKRVKGFEDKWDNYKLEYFFEEYSSKPKQNTDLPVFTSSKNGLMSQSDYYSGGRISTRENVDYNIIPRDYITYRSRSDDGLFTFNKNTAGYDGLISGYYPVFKVVNGNDNFFLYYLNFFKTKLTKYSTGTSQLVLSFKALKSAMFNLPSLEEQNAIAEILNTANQEVKQYQQKLEALKLQKKGLMQQLLTGKVRTV
ncbi:restriction endonuclease subunit S [Empedobacter brevis]